MAFVSNTARDAGPTIAGFFLQVNVSMTFCISFRTAGFLDIFGPPRPSGSRPNLSTPPHQVTHACRKDTLYRPFHPENVGVLAPKSGSLRPKIPACPEVRRVHARADRTSQAPERAIGACKHW